MSDNAFIGMPAVDGTLPLAVMCTNVSDVPTSPDSAPTYSVRNSEGTEVASGTLSSNPGSITGLRFAALTISSGTYTAGQPYFVVVNYAVASTSYAALLHFQVR